METLRAANPHTEQGQTMKSSKGGGSWSKEAINYGKQERETVKQDIAGTQHKGPCNKAHKCKPLGMAATYSIGSSLT